MSFTMITPHHNHDTGYIAFILSEFKELPKEVKVGQKTLTRKGEFHVSLMALKNILPLIHAVDQNVTEDDLVQDFLDYQKQNPLSECKLTNQFRYIKRDTRETVVEMVEVPGLEGLFESLRTKYGVDIPTQPTHITLYTLQPEIGIGIFSQGELKRDGTPVNLPELA